MSLIWNEEGVVVEDRWSEGEFLSLAEAKAAADGGADEIAVRIEPADDVRCLAGYLDRLAIVAVHFPSFNDGRAFSQASLLRDRMGYGGEIRAVGAVLLDQVPFMLRVGVTSVETGDEPTARRLTEMRLPGIELHCQPTAKSNGSNGEAYSWRRRVVTR